MNQKSKNKNFLMEQLYEASQTTDDQGLSSTDERKLAKQLQGNKKLMARNKDIYAEGEPKFHTCKWYDPCPICEKCKNKASHLYVKCQSCQIPNCVHTFKNINTMIKRKNFIIELSDPNFKKAFKNLDIEKETENESNPT